jgi:hypothetical protein
MMEQVSDILESQQPIPRMRKDPPCMVVKQEKILFTLPRLPLHYLSVLKCVIVHPVNILSSKTLEFGHDGVCI